MATNSSSPLNSADSEMEMATLKQKEVLSPKAASTAGEETPSRKSPKQSEEIDVAAERAKFLEAFGEKPMTYQIWSLVGGRNRFPCEGRCVTGPPADCKLNVLAWAFIVIPSILYFSTCAPLLWRQSGPTMPLLTIAAFCCAIGFLLLTSCTDPGIIPRRELQFVVSNLRDEVSLATATEPLSRASICFSAEMDEQGYRWCPTCKIVRPPRGAHCRVCDNCVLRFDHHCPFVNNCIGQRNYAYFVAFLASIVSLGVSVFVGIAVCIGGQAGATTDFGELSFAGKAVTILLCAVAAATALLLFAVLVLGLFHTVLMLSGRTTKELLKGRTGTGKDGAKARSAFSSLPALVDPRARTTFPAEVDV